MTIIKQFIGLPQFIVSSNLGKMLQFDNTVLQEPYKSNGTFYTPHMKNSSENPLEDPGLKIISEPCNMETSKGIRLRGTLSFTAKNKGKSLPVIMYVYISNRLTFALINLRLIKKKFSNKKLRIHVF